MTFKPCPKMLLDFAKSRYCLVLLIVLLGEIAGLTLSACAQTFRILHYFSTQAHNPTDGLTADAAGNLYGATESGGSFAGNCVGSGCGTVFRLTFRNSSWLYTPIYEFQLGNDGAFPQAAPVLGPDGSLYGTTLEGGGSANCTYGCGVVYKLLPPPTTCPSTLCRWSDKVIYAFATQTIYDGMSPASRVTFDSAGNLYGTTKAGGNRIFGPNEGTAYELIHSQNSWSETILYSFLGGLFGDIGSPASEVILDQVGNLYGTGEGVDCGIHQGCGAVYELSPAQGGWREQYIHVFNEPGDGINPMGAPIWDGAGNMYGSTSEDSLAGNNGPTIWKLSPSNGTWTDEILYTWPLRAPGGNGSLTMDAQGNLYGVQFVYQQGNGSVFKLANNNGVWTYSTLHEFNGSDGSYPNGSLVVDRDGNIFGTTYAGGSSAPYCSGGCGVIFEISQH